MSDQRSISLYSLRFTAIAQEPLELEEHPGSAIRGAFFGSLWGRFCVNKDAPACAECVLMHTCPVAMLVAPLRDEYPRGRDIPRPFVIEPLSLAAGVDRRIHLAPGSTFAIGITLVGNAVTLLPYVLMAAQVMEQHGIGRPLTANGGRRGRFVVERIEAVDPFSGQTQPLYRRGEAKVATPTLAVTPQRIAERAAALSTERLTLRFLSPTRLIAEGQLMRRPDLRTLVLRLLERLDALEYEYGETAAPTPGKGGVDGIAKTINGERVPVAVAVVGSDAETAWQRRTRLAEAATGIKLVEDKTRWVDVASYSRRQGRTTPIGGFIGTATYVGELTPLREVLVWGEVLHVGKNAVKGDGLYRIDA